jgi:L-histidine N-alpha-methyltransferase
MDSLTRNQSLLRRAEYPTMMSQPGSTDTLCEFAVAVSESLGKVGQRELPSMYLYDEVGTALFEAITLLPEYGLTRAELRLLSRHAGAMVEHLAPPVAVVELGSGSGRKTRWILEALADREPVAYFPIDVSAAALLKCRQELGNLGSVSMVGLERSYLEGLQEAAARRRPDQTLLVLFLGSSIGNFDPPAAENFLRDIRRHLKPGDALLLGTDIEKSVGDMLLAYGDPTGVTAAFNLNLLARINRELGGDFSLRHFEHHVRYQDMHRRIEMHLRSTRKQTVSIRAADFTFTLNEGETIWTEACHKFRVEDIPGLARRTGFLCDSQWIDTEWTFAENLLIAA